MECGGRRSLWSPAAPCARAERVDVATVRDRTHLSRALAPRAGADLSHPDPSGAAATAVTASGRPAVGAGAGDDRSADPVVGPRPPVSDLAAASRSRRVRPRTAAVALVDCGPDQVDPTAPGAGYVAQRAALKRPGDQADAAAVAEGIVKDLFAVGLTMCSALPYTDVVGSVRIRLAVAQLDDIISLIRPLLMDGRRQAGGHRPCHPTRSGPPTGAAG